MLDTLLIDGLDSIDNIPALIRSSAKGRVVKEVIVILENKDYVKMKKWGRYKIK